MANRLWKLLVATKPAKRRGVLQSSGAFGKNDGKLDAGVRRLILKIRN